MPINKIGTPQLAGLNMIMTKPQFQGLKLKPKFIKPDRPQFIKTILLVEDDLMILKMIPRLLGRISDKLEVLKVDPALPIPKQAHDLCWEADLVIMDGNLPGVLGSDLVSGIRASGYKGYIFANSSSPLQQEAMILAGADMMLDKLDLNFGRYFEGE